MTLAGSSGSLPLDSGQTEGRPDGRMDGSVGSLMDRLQTEGHMCPALSGGGHTQV